MLIYCVVLSLGIVPRKLFFQFCKPFLFSHHFECLELLNVYSIVIKLDESSYFIPALLPSTISQLSTLLRATSLDSHIIYKGNEHVQTLLTGKQFEHTYQSGTDEQNSSDEDDNTDYISDLVDRVSRSDEHVQHRVNRLVHSDKEQAYFYSPVPSHKTRSLPSVNNFYNVHLMDSSSFEKSMVLSLLNDGKGTGASALSNKDIEASFYPSLCRIWFSSFIPDGFWPRLLSMIVSDNEINSVLLKLLPKVQSPCDQKYSLWTLWQSGVTIIHNNIVMLELKHEPNLTMNDDKNLVIKYEKYRIFLSINTNVFIMLHSTDQKYSLSHQEVLSFTTKLLVLIEKLLLEIEEWFPGTLEQTISGGVMSYIPCYHCMHQEKVAMQFSYTKYIALYHSGLKYNVCCFDFNQMLQLYSDNDKSAICQHHGRVLLEYCVPDIVSTLMF